MRRLERRAQVFGLLPPLRLLELPRGELLAILVGEHEIFIILLGLFIFFFTFLVLHNLLNRGSSLAAFQTAEHTDTLLELRDVGSVL